MPNDFVLADNKTLKENARIAATILEVEIERLLDEELGTVGSDVHTNIHFVVGRLKKKNAVSRGVAVRPQKICLPNKNCELMYMRVIVLSHTSVKSSIVTKAANKLEKTEGFQDVFKIGKSQKKTIKIKRKKKGKKYVLKMIRYVNPDYFDQIFQRKEAQFI